MLFEASGHFEHEFSRLKTTTEVTTSESCLRFYFFMFGHDLGILKVKFHDDEYANERVLWQRWRSVGNTWQFAYVNVPAGEFYLVFEAWRGASFRADIAVDDVTLLPGACPDAAQCDEDEFRCAAGHCIASEFVCNSRDDCGDFSDEFECECSLTEQWQCDFGMCVDSRFRCDGLHQCPDHSDEVGCQCPVGRVRCPLGECIQREWLCDGDHDCTYGWDEGEQNCPLCPGGQFRCGDQTCIASDKHCDGYTDCADHSDESDCVSSIDDVTHVWRGGVWHALCFDGFPLEQQQNVCHLTDGGETLAL